MISIIIPAYNEQDSIVNTINGIVRVMPSLSAFPSWDEIIVVDDGSIDNTYELADDLTLGYPVRVICHPYNKGYGAALKTGVRAAKGEWVVFIDADGQHNAGDISRLFENNAWVDMVVGARSKGSKIAASRGFAKKFLNWFAEYLAGRKIPDLNSGFRAVKREVVLKYLGILPDKFSFTTTITLALMKDGYNVAYVPIVTKESVSKSKVRVRDAWNFFMLIVNMAVLFEPMKVFGPVALVLLVAGLGYGAFSVVTSHGLALTSGVLLLSAVMTFFFGLIAHEISLVRKYRG